jgi:hypothetical protein
LILLRPKLLGDFLFADTKNPFASITPDWGANCIFPPVLLDRVAARHKFCEASL